MGDIYRCATKVIVWLGPGTDDSLIAMQALRLAASHVRFDDVYRPLPKHEDNCDPDWLDMRKPLPYDHETWTSLVSMLNRTWFSRLWIWQEIFLSRDHAVVTCGKDTMPWNDFRQSIFCLIEKGIPSKYESHDCFLQAADICYLRNPLTIGRTLQRSQWAQCSDPRDRIFAVLHLIPEAERRLVRPDYTKTPGEVYRDLVIHTSVTTRDLNLLSYCEIGDQDSSMPSWVPNWAVPCLYYAILNASADANSGWLGHYTSTQETLVVTGHEVAKVTDSHDILSDSSSIPKTNRYSRLKHYHDVMRSLIRGLRYRFDQNFDRQVERICRTIYQNTFADEYEPPFHRHLDFKATLEFFSRVIAQDEKKAVEKDYLEKASKFLCAFHNIACGKTFIVTDRDNIGLAPRSCEEGDIVAVIFGCEIPLLLRPTMEGTFRVVGACWVEGIMTGESFLGPLPEGWQCIAHHDEEKGGYYDHFKNLKTGRIQVRDPRSLPLPDGWIEVDHPGKHLYTLYQREEEEPNKATRFDPRINPHYLRNTGVSTREFALV
ncbi:uncharacterized protein KY384_009276 [Bacidia gigantensis]|uniref:uncharacterized protein n=1 Tax=Bacidia gigantensis TaxID=2732470 RepID=UPI001D041290|nr:uncharacterized protein KY384_009276 [Bacidia gigantensis]KAG8525632.1 hypothetical protein KY384_009276 [Bacidia gigantensis]